MENKVNKIVGLWQRKRVYFLFSVTFLVFILLSLTGVKLIAYALEHPRISGRTKEASFCLVMAYRTGIKENRRDKFLKAVNKSPHVFLRASCITQENKTTQEGKKK